MFESKVKKGLKKRSRAIRIGQGLLAQLDGLTINRSQAIEQAVTNAYEDDGLILKALKRRLALTQGVESADLRVGISQSDTVAAYLEELAYRSGLSEEEIIRLSVEAFIHKL